MPDVGLITCRQLPEPDPDQELLSNALADAGISAEMILWDDPGARPSDYRLCVFRSCWNYFEEIDAFFRWLATAERSVALVNSAEVVRWNLHKRYLTSLEEEGIPIVPTVFGWRGQNLNLDRILQYRGWNDIVIKPAISAGSVRTRRFKPADAGGAQGFLDALSKEWDVMIQPYFPSVESSHGERSVIGIDGAWTHTVRKAPRFDGDEETVSEAFEVAHEEAAIADRCLEALPGEVLYARIDLMRDDHGRLHVSEVEVIEPSLFLSESPTALQRYVNGIARIVRGE
jgi:hypothetical protein